MSRLNHTHLTSTESATMSELVYFEAHARETLRATSKLDLLYGPRHIPASNSDGRHLIALADNMTEQFSTLRFWLDEAQKLYPGYETDWAIATDALHTLGMDVKHEPGSVAREAVVLLGFLSLVRTAIESGIERAHHESEQFVDSRITHVHGKGDRL